jgi:prevent-host-death family protein
MMQAPKTWNLQDAKAKLSEVVDLAQAGKPQVILRRGKPAAAVISIDQFEASQPKTSLISFLLHSPLRGSKLDLSHADEHYESPARIFDEAE